MSHDGEIHLFEPRRRKDLAESDKGSNVPLYAWSDSRRRGSVADGHQAHRTAELQKNRASALPANSPFTIRNVSAVAFWSFTIRHSTFAIRN
jgi:hypothetical protein